MGNKKSELTSTQKNYISKRIKEITEKKLEQIRKDTPGYIFDWNKEIRKEYNLSNYELEIMALKKGLYTINNNPDFTSKNSLTDYYESVVIISPETKNNLLKNARNNFEADKKKYLLRVEAVTKEKTRLLDELLLCNAQDSLELIKNFESFIA